MDKSTKHDRKAVGRETLPFPTGVCLNTMPALMSKQSINYNLYTLVSSLSKGATQFYVAHFGVGQPEMRILSTLGNQGPLAAHQIVDHTAMDKALVSRVLAALARRSYVASAATGCDGRRRAWELTQSGHDLVGRLQPVWKQREAILQADMSPEEQRALVGMLQRIYVASERLRAEEARQAKAAREPPAAGPAVRRRAAPVATRPPPNGD